MQSGDSAGVFSLDRRGTAVAVIGVAMVAVVMAVVMISLSSNPAGVAKTDFGDVPRSRLPDGGFVIGYDTAPITVVEFADFLCPHCQEYHEITAQFIRQFVLTGQARFEYRLYPVIDPNWSAFTAQLVECADAQQPGLFWNAYEEMFRLASLRTIGANTARDFASTMGLDYNTLLQCTSTARQYLTDYDLGQQMGVQGTPAVMVRGADGVLQWINYNGALLDRGGVTLDILAEVVRRANAGRQ